MRTSSVFVACALYLRFAAAAPVPNDDIATRDNTVSQGHIGASARTRRGSSSSSVSALTEPLVMGVANPLTTGLGQGVAGGAAGTQQTADLLGDAAATLFHTLGGVAGNTEQGAGVAVANGAPAVQGTVEAVQDNDGVVGDVAKILGS